MGRVMFFSLVLLGVPGCPHQVAVCSRWAFLTNRETCCICVHLDKTSLAETELGRHTFIKNGRGTNIRKEKCACILNFSNRTDLHFDASTN